MKLKIISYVLELKNSQELRDLCIQVKTPETEENNGGSMESVRKIVQLDLSPIREVFLLMNFINELMNHK